MWITMSKRTVKKHTHYRDQWNQIWLIKLLFWKVQMEQGCWHRVVDSTEIWTPKFEQHGTAIEEIVRYRKKYCMNYDSNHVRCGKKTENTTWIMTIIYATGSNRKIPLGKEEWVDERCYYLDRLQNIPTPDNKENR